jgi:membrane protein implicated in regulation of membrane protease activity
MSWWGWLIFGIVLAGAELLSDAAFYLVFAGAAAIVVGVLGLTGIGLPVWAQWVAFSVLAIASMVLFRRKLYDRLRGGGRELRHPAVGAVVDVAEDIAAGGRTRVRLQGTEWTAVNVGPDSIAGGARAVVVDIDGVALEIVEDLPAEPPVH